MQGGDGFSIGLAVGKMVGETADAYFIGDDLTLERQEWASNLRLLVSPLEQGEVE